MWSLLALVLSQAPLLVPCPIGWEPLRGDACLLRGDRPGLVLYFHGMSAPSAAAQAWELGFLAQVARARRTPAVALRGTPGLCDWAEEYQSWWCWPTDREHPEVLAEVVERTYDAVAAAKVRLGRDDGPPVLAGYSNGGFLVSLLMGETRVPAGGWAVMHAGGVTGVTFPRDRERPTLLLAAAGDFIQRPTMEKLQARLAEAGWTSVLVVRPGAHPLELEDFQRLFDFATTVGRAP